MDVVVIPRSIMHVVDGHSAEVRWFGRDEGGIEAARPSPHVSIMLAFEGEAAKTAVIIDTDDGSPLEPGATQRVRIKAVYAETDRRWDAGKRFVLWEGRDLGEGTFD